ncbi:MAG: MFS transporter [Candidatus Heimdallarchaeota archaeon]|nr:MFS transporter [Candidatus Heimdallarchaeota archaeon]
MSDDEQPIDNPNENIVLDLPSTSTINQPDQLEPQIPSSTSSSSINYLEQWRGKQKVFWFISIANGIAQMILFNIFPAFAAVVGVTSSMMGFLTSIRNLISSLFQGTFGRLSDKYGRKHLLLVGFFLIFAMTTILVFIHNPIMLVIVVILQSFSLSIIIPVWNAALGDVTEIKGRSTYIGKLTSAGYVVAVGVLLLIVGFFFLTDSYANRVVLGLTIPKLGWEIHYGVTFAIIAINFLFCFIGILFLRETRPVNSDKVNPKLRVAFKDKSFRKFLFINSLFGFTMAALWPIYPITQVRILGMSFYQVAICVAIFSICFGLFGFLGGKISDKIGRKPVILFSRLMMFTIPPLYIPAILFQQWWFLVLTNVVSGIGNGIFLVVTNSYALDLSSEQLMGAYSGLKEVAWGIATFLGSICAGFVTQALELSWTLERTIIVLVIVITVLRLVVAFGYLFVTESLTENDT